MPVTRHEFRVRRDNLRDCKIFDGEVPATNALQPSEIILKIDRFALTSNNITYAAFGDRMKYWDFFPAPDGWGTIPVWGFADVVTSAAGGIKAGERFYGYFPMASHVRLAATRVSKAGFVDEAGLRAPLAAVYNFYTRTAADPAYNAQHENEQALLKPLFFTSFLIADFLAGNKFFGATTVILSSASSKTAYGLAHELAKQPAPRARVLGLTSARNKAFTTRLGCYDEVCTYDEIATLPVDEKAVYVDMSGDAAVRTALHTRFGDQMTYSCSVGGTHWENLGGGGALPGPRPVLFFAPAQIKKRTADWGPGEVQKRLAAAWTVFLPKLGQWMRVIEGRGAAAIEQTYRAVLDGKVGPDEGHMLGF